jgi:plastocyanin
MQSKMMIWGGAAILGLSLTLAACNNDVKTPIDTGGTIIVCPATIKTTASLTYDPPACTAKVGQQISIEASGFHPLKGATVGGPIDTTTAATSTVTFTVDKAGKLEFFCQNHGSATSGMKGTITFAN